MPEVYFSTNLSTLNTELHGPSKWEELQMNTQPSIDMARILLGAKVGNWYECLRLAHRYLKRVDWADPRKPAFLRKGMDGKLLWCLLDVTHVTIPSDR